MQAEGAHTPTLVCCFVPLASAQPPSLRVSARSCLRTPSDRAVPLSSPESIVQCRYVASEPEPERSLQAAAKAAAKADEEQRRIAVTEALELKKSELEWELKENGLNRQQKAELNQQLKVTLGELAASRRPENPENRWTKSIESAAHLDAFVRSMPAADQTARHLTGPLSDVHNREVGSSLPTPPHLPSPVRRVRSIGQFAAS